MWDRLLVDCNIATMDPAVPGPFGAIENGAIGIQDGRVVRVGRRVELAGYQARSVEALGGAWVTPGLIDCTPTWCSAATGPASSSRGSKAPATSRSPPPAAASFPQYAPPARPASTS